MKVHAQVKLTLAIVTAISMLDKDDVLELNPTLLPNDGSTLRIVNKKNNVYADFGISEHGIEVNVFSPQDGYLETYHTPVDVTDFATKVYEELTNPTVY